MPKASVKKGFAQRPCAIYRWPVCGVGVAVVVWPEGLRYERQLVTE